MKLRSGTIAGPQIEGECKTDVNMANSNDNMANLGDSDSSYEIVEDIWNEIEPRVARFFLNEQKERRELLKVIGALREETMELRNHITNLEDLLSTQISHKPQDADLVANDNSSNVTAEDKINIQLTEVRHNLKMRYYSERKSKCNSVNTEATNTERKLNTEETISKYPLNTDAKVDECPLQILPTAEIQSTLKSTDDKNASKLPQTSKDGHQWPKGTTLIVGDSMLGGVQERLIGPRGNIKVRSFPGANSDDMKDYIRPLLRKCPEKIVLHVGTNDAIESSPEEIVEKIVSVKSFIESKLESCNVIISSPINRLDSQKFAVKIRNANAILKTIEGINLLCNDNIGTKHLGTKKLHLNMSGTKLLVTNILSKLRSF